MPCLFAMGSKFGHGQSLVRIWSTAVLWRRLHIPYSHVHVFSVLSGTWKWEFSLGPCPQGHGHNLLRGSGHDRTNSHRLKHT